VHAQLPASTGCSIEEFENSSIYKTTREFLLSMVGKGLFSDILYGAVCIMDDLADRVVVSK
jgi:hypothetical protein